MKVWLDDVRPKPPEYDAHVATAAHAIKLLASGVVTEISLDHDLGEAAAGTGYDVAKWMEAAAYNSQLKRIIWHIHSGNPVGVKNMQIALENADFYWDLENIE